MKAIITTFDAEAVTLSLAAAGPIDETERDRLYELFRSSVVLEVHVAKADGEVAPHLTLGASGSHRHQPSTQVPGGPHR